MNTGLLSWRWSSLSFGTEKYRICFEEEKYPSTRIGREKPAHGVDKLNEIVEFGISHGI
jgi:hypothetical protein